MKEQRLLSICGFAFKPLFRLDLSVLTERIIGAVYHESLIRSAEHRSTRFSVQDEVRP